MRDRNRTSGRACADGSHRQRLAAVRSAAVVGQHVDQDAAGPDLGGRGVIDRRGVVIDVVDVDRNRADRRLGVGLPVGRAVVADRILEGNRAEEVLRRRVSDGVPVETCRAFGGCADTDDVRVWSVSPAPAESLPSKSATLSVSTVSSFIERISRPAVGTSLTSVIVTVT